MNDYVGAFDDAKIIGLTGTPEQVIVAEAAYRVRARRHGRYTATIDNMDPDGRFVAMARPERIGERLARLVP